MSRQAGILPGFGVQCSFKIVGNNKLISTLAQQWQPKRSTESPARRELAKNDQPLAITDERYSPVFNILRTEQGKVEISQAVGPGSQRFLSSSQEELKLDGSRLELIDAGLLPPCRDICGEGRKRQYGFAAVVANGKGVGFL